MQPDNLGLCNTCRGQVPSEFVVRDGQVHIRKNCPQCGPNESLVSTDAAAWQAKRDLVHYTNTDRKACTLKCEHCSIDHHPNMVFLDVTNRCNMNCPICIATIRDMGFDFNPPLSYFENIFAELAKMDPKPVVQLFGGEPTVREDLLDIIAIARKHGLRPHVVTNGLRLADEEYCKKLCQAAVPMRFAFDGRNADIYEKLRNNRPAYAKKMKALENLKKYSRRKHAIIACAAWGFNDKYIPDFLQFLHDNRDLISDVGIIPLTENWKEGEFQVSAHTTMEDVEKMVAQSVTGGGVEFIPAGLSYALKKPRSFFRDNPRSEVLLLAGVHPNCESITLLKSDGKTYRSLSHWLKMPLSKMAVEFAARSKKIEPKLDALDRSKFFQRLRGQLLCIAAFGPWLLTSIRWWRLNLLSTALSGIGGKIRKLLGSKRPSARRPRQIIRVAILPFEEQHSIDAARLENCKAVFAYEDTDDGQVKYFPACGWYPYRNPRLEKISQKYGVVRYGRGAVAQDPLPAAAQQEAPAATV